jgi:hypothetical protein
MLRKMHYKSIRLCINSIMASRLIESKLSRCVFSIFRRVVESFSKQSKSQRSQGSRGVGQGVAESKTSVAELFKESRSCSRSRGVVQGVAESNSTRK